MKVEVFGLILLLLLSGVVNAESIEWYFLDSDAGNGLNGKLMAANQGKETRTIILHNRESAWWFSEPVKENTVYYGDWKVVYWAKTDSGKKRWINVRLYIAGESGLLKVADGHNVIYPGEDVQMKEREFESVFANLKQGDRIAVEIQWSKNAEKTLTLYFNSANYPSHLELDLENPNPPVPELPTFLLVIGGIISVVLVRVRS